MPPTRVDACLRSRTCQALGIVVTLLVVSWLHGRNDGLWFQGDAPRHAMNGLFWWDLLRALPADPLAFTVSYYARYPVIAPVTYPPLFYLLEGFVFQVLGPAPHAAKGIVLLFAAMAGAYTMAWARRWIGGYAGWAGSVLLLVPGVLLWSNAVMLNIPAAGLGLACLYHVRRWLESPTRAQLLLAAAAVAAVLLTYYQGGSVVFVALAWLLFLVPWKRDASRDSRHDSRGPARGRRSLRLWYLALAGAMALVPLGMAASLARVQLARHLPTLEYLTRPRTWTFYWHELPELLGPVVLVLGACGGAVGLLTSRWRADAVYLGSWVLIVIATLSLLPAKDARYILLIAPAFVLGAAMFLAILFNLVPVKSANWRAALLVIGMAAGVWSATRVAVPEVSGFREVAEYLSTHAPHDAVLYDGPHDGLFGFYVRALDPRFERRIARADRLLYSYGPRTTFRDVETATVSSALDVTAALRTRCGCAWVALEMGPRAERAATQRLLRQAVTESAFELVRLFPVRARGIHEVALYRVLGPVAPVVDLDLSFPSFSEQTFTGVVPIER